MIAGLLRRRTSGIPETRWQFETAAEPNLVIDLGSDAAGMLLRVNCDKPVIANLVVGDGELVPIGNGTQIVFEGDTAGASAVNLSVKKGEVVAYMCYVTRKPRIFQPVDPIPVSVTVQTPVPPGIPQVIRDFIEERLAAAGIKDAIVDDVLADLDDQAFDWDDVKDPVGDFDFGEGALLEDDPPEPLPKDKKVAIGVKQQPAEPVPDPLAPKAPVPPDPALVPPHVAST